MRELEFREIKFRAFDTENKTWTFATLGDLICGACTEKGDKPLSGAKQVWVRYTGLKDKNGKDIYEGDIIDFFGEKYPVIYRAGCFWAEYSRTQKDYLFLYAIDSEVIGNILENPELSEGKE